MTPLFLNLNLRFRWKAILILLLCAGPAVHGQNRIKLQADAGLSIASLKMTVLGIQNKELHSLMGFQGRILTGYAFTQNLNLRTGLAYVKLGAEQKHDDHHDQIRIDGLEIPLGLNYQTPIGNGSVGISAGPAITVHLAAKNHSQENGIEEESELTIGNNVIDFIKPLNLNLQAELSYTHQSGILLNLRYNAGLLDLGTSDLVQMQTSYLALGLGYRLF